METVNYVFRVDSSGKIGSGHLMRCLTLAMALRDVGALCSFICRALEGNLNHLVVSEGFSLNELAQSGAGAKATYKNEPYHSSWREVGWEVDAAETLSVLSVLKPQWLVVDHYGLWYDCFYIFCTIFDAFKNVLGLTHDLLKFIETTPVGSLTSKSPIFLPFR